MENANGKRAMHMFNRFSRSDRKQSTSRWKCQLRISVKVLHGNEGDKVNDIIKTASRSKLK